MDKIIPFNRIENKVEPVIIGVEGVVSPQQDQQQEPAADLPVKAGGDQIPVESSKPFVLEPKECVSEKEQREPAVPAPQTSPAAVDIVLPPAGKGPDLPKPAMHSTAAPAEPQSDAGQHTPKPLNDADVLAHTSSLWQYHPIPEDEPDPMPEYLCGAPRLHDAQVTAARVRGKKHKNEGTNCDDWYEVSEICGDVTILVAADGAGSRKFSRVGARAACEGASAFLQQAWQEMESSQLEFRKGLGQDLNDPAVKDRAMASYGLAAQLVQRAVAAGFDSLTREFEKRSSDSRYSRLLGRDLVVEDLACTLLLAVSVPIGGSYAGEHAIFTCQVGDGMIAIIDSLMDDPAKALRLLAEADSGEFSGETDFLTSRKIVARNNDGTYPELQRRTRVTRTRAEYLLLMSDGVADDYYPNNPEMLRLYFDLMLNGVLGDEAMSERLHLEDAAEAKIFHNLPQPRSFMAVTENPHEVELSYAKDIEDRLKMDTVSLWQKQNILRAASILMKDNVYPIPEGAEKAEKSRILSVRLRDWLDNYTERGSFDDRTLVIARLRR